MPKNILYQIMDLPTYQKSMSMIGYNPKNTLGNPLPKSQFYNPNEVPSGLPLDLRRRSFMSPDIKFEDPKPDYVNPELAEKPNSGIINFEELDRLLKIENKDASLDLGSSDFNFSDIDIPLKPEVDGLEDKFGNPISPIQLNRFGNSPLVDGDRGYSLATGKPVKNYLSKALDKSKEYLSGLFDENSKLAAAGSKIKDFINDDSYDAKMDKFSLLSGAIEAGGILANISALNNDKKAQIFNPIDKVGAEYHSFKSPDIVTSGTNAIDKSEARYSQMARELGTPEAVSGILANSLSAKGELNSKQGMIDSESYNKTIALNTEISKYVNELNTKVDMYNSEGKMKESMAKSEMVNADRNAIFQGIKNIGSIYGNNILSKEQQRMNEEYLKLENYKARKI